MAAAEGVLTSALLCAGCGGSSATPAPAPGPPTPTNAVNLSGSWTGTMESANFPSRTITMDVAQSADCVDGSWSTVPAGWDGGISGYADTASYSGLMSIELVGTDGGKCSGTTQISGDASTSAITWKSTGFTSYVGTCAGGLPQSVVVTLHRP
jgi:hypothetical protein